MWELFIAIYLHGKLVAVLSEPGRFVYGEQCHDRGRRIQRAVRPRYTSKRECRLGYHEASAS